MSKEPFRGHGAVAAVVAVAHKHDYAFIRLQEPKHFFGRGMTRALLKRRLTGPACECRRLQRPHLGDGDDLHPKLERGPRARAAVADSPAAAGVGGDSA